MYLDAKHALTHLKPPYRGPQCASHHYTPPCQMTHIVVIQSSIDF